MKMKTIRLSFHYLEFEDKADLLRVNLFRYFYIDLSKRLFKSIGSFKAGGHSIAFTTDLDKGSLEGQFNSVIAGSISGLRNSLNNRRAVYVHRNSGIPLIGSVSFSIIDRNTSLIEIKPVTGCNLNCIYCSVGEGANSELTDFVVEPEYIIECFKRLVEFKRQDNSKLMIEAHIGCQGEPLLYSALPELVAGIKGAGCTHLASDRVGGKGIGRRADNNSDSGININKRNKNENNITVSIDTNGTLLTEASVDKLVQAGMDRFNISINALEPGLAREIAGCCYNLDHVKEIAKYIAKKAELLIAPVLIPSINECEIIKIVEFAKSLSKYTKDKKPPVVGIQNFLEYRTGRNPVRQWGWNRFYRFIAELEEQTGVKLRMSESDFSITKTRPLPKPFRKGSTITARVVCPGRHKGETICAASDRVITVRRAGSAKQGQEIKVKTTGDKHNVFYGENLEHARFARISRFS